MLQTDIARGNILVSILKYLGVKTKGTGKVYVSNEADDTVSVIDKATATVKKKISVGSSPHHIHRSADGKFVYVALFGADKVAVISTVTDMSSAST